MNLESIQDQLEKLMINPPRTASSSKPYLAGYIDAMFDAGFLTNQERANLFFNYAFPEECLRLRNICGNE